MKVLLIHPPIDIEKNLGSFKSISEATPPLGLAYLASVLCNNRVDVVILDAFAENLSIEEIVDKVKKLNPGVIGFSMVTPTVPICCELAIKVKEVCNAIIVFGGIHPSLLTKETLSNKAVDIVIRGEGEFSFLELVKAIENGKKLSTVKGISYKKGNKIFNNLDRHFIRDLDRVPFPAWHLFDLDKYRPLPHWVLTSSKKPIFPMLTSRGCPYRCTYCSLQTVGRVHRKRSVKNVVDEIEWLVNKFNATQIMFWDATFPLVKERGMVLCNEIINRGLHKKIKWMTETRVNVVDLELLKKMKESGCKRIAYGLESGNQQLLDNIKKGFKLEQVRIAVKLTKRAGIEVLAYFMLGLPGETKELSRQTIDFAKELNADYTKFNLTVPYPGTEMWELALKEGSVKSRDWGSFNSFAALSTFNPIYVPLGMTKEELVTMTRQAFKEYYFRPNIILNHLLKINSLDSLNKYLKIFMVLVKFMLNQGTMKQKRMCKVK